MTSPKFKLRHYRLFRVLHLWGITAAKHLCLQLYIESMSEKCARDNPERQYRIWSIPSSWQCIQSNLLLLLPLAVANTFMASCAILSNFFEDHWTQNLPQYLSGLSRALFPTNFLEIAVYKYSVRKGSSICDIGTLEFPKLLRDAVCRWRPGQLSSRLKMLQIFFLRFGYLNISCFRINITLIFMSSSSEELTLL